MKRTHIRIEKRIAVCIQNPNVSSTDVCRCGILANRQRTLNGSRNDNASSDNSLLVYRTTQPDRLSRLDVRVISKPVNYLSSANGRLEHRGQANFRTNNILSAIVETTICVPIVARCYRNSQPDRRFRLDMRVMSNTVN